MCDISAMYAYICGTLIYVTIITDISMAVSTKVERSVQQRRHNVHKVYRTQVGRYIASCQCKSIVDISSNGCMYCGYLV